MEPRVESRVAFARYLIEIVLVTVAESLPCLNLKVKVYLPFLMVLVACRSAWPCRPAGRPTGSARRC